MSSRLSALWSEGTAASRAAFVALAVTIVALAVWAGAWVLRADYQPLFADLDPRDAASIAEELERMKVPYRAGEDGRSLMVDGDAVHLTRLKVMGKGIDLKGTVGFEIFNNTDFGMTEFAQKINYQRALQGELARTIAALEEIKSARVHLVLPESGLLKRSTVRPKASVTLVVRGERRLQPAQIHGIQRLIAASVAEMQAAAVTVLDQQGVALSRRVEAEPDNGAAYVKLESKREAEAYLTRKVVEILDRALGPGQAIVSVDVTLYHDHVKTTREDVLQMPGARGGAVARRRDALQGADGAAVAAAAGAAAARPAGSRSSEIEYLHGRKVEQVVSSPGGVRRISVGLLLPAHVTAAQAEGLKQIIAMAVGLNAARGDAIALTRAAPALQAPVAVDPAPPVPAVARHPKSVRIPLVAQVPSSAWAALAGALALLAALLLYAARRRGARTLQLTALSEPQREEMLGRMRAWIAHAERQA
jgi:flagellar M-ring protein FliF